MIRFRSVGGWAVTGAAAACLLLVTMPQPSAQATSTCEGQNGGLGANVRLRYTGEGSTIASVSPTGRIHRLFPSYGVGAEVFGPSFSCDGKRVIYAGDNESLCDFME